MAAHAKLNPPADFRPYGATQGYAPSGESVDGLPVHWFSELGWGPAPQNDGFGHYVFRQVGARRAEYAFYKEGTKDVMNGRGDLIAGADGNLYVTGNESDADKLCSVFRVPGYVPVSRGRLELVAVGEQAVAALLERINELEARLNAGQSTPTPTIDPSWGKRLAAVEGVANKASERSQNALNQLAELRQRPVGISRDEAWQLAADRMYAEVSNEQSGVSGAIKAQVAKLVGAAKPANLSPLEARVKAVEGQVASKVDGATAEAIAKWSITDWLAASIAYTDRRLLNLLWDRAVKLLRYKETSGKTAEELPVNDPKNLEV